MNTVELFGIQLACLDLDGLMSQVVDWTTRDNRRTVFYANAHVVNQVCRDEHLMSAFQAADLVYTDGAGVAWAAEYLHGVHLTKMTGADWIHAYCQVAVKNGLRTYILAGQPSVAEAASVAEVASANLVQQYEELAIVGSRDGFFSPEQNDLVIQDINQAEPDVVFVGMGTPHQELWLNRNRAALNAPVCWAVGALFDYVSGYERRVPAILYACHLEWLWRLISDPRGKWRRYLLGNPEFIYRVVKHRLITGRI